MGIRLKVLISIFCFTAVYAFYYFALPRLIDLNKINPFITNYIKKEYNYTVKIDNPSFKTALSPAIWLKADNFSVLNDDGSAALSVEKPLLKVSLFPLIVGKVGVKYFESDSIFADLHCDNSFRISLGQYLLLKSSNFIVDINGSTVHIGKFAVNFTSDEDKKKIVFLGNFFDIDKYIENRVLQVSSDLLIKTFNKESRVSFNVNTKLPFNKNLDNFPPELAMSITNLELSEFKSFIKNISKGDISDISGLINLDIHSDKKIFDQKQYISNLIIENIKCSSKYLQKPYSYPHKIQLDSRVLLENNVLNIPSIAFKAPNFTMKLSGSIDKITSKNPIPNLDLKMFNAKAEDLLALIPHCDELNNLAKINISVAKDANFHSDVNVDLKITNNLIKPLMYGKILVDNAYVFEPIKKAPKGAFIGIEYKGDYLDLDVNVPTDKNQEVNVKGSIRVYGEQDCNLHITSTPLIDLALAKKVLMPVHKTFNFLIGPVPVMQFSGFGSIDLVVKGNRRDPHTFGWFKTLNVTTYFDDVKGFVLKNANALLKFEDFNTKFTLISGTINGKPVSIDGTCNLNGVFDFVAKTPKQNLNDLLIVLKTSPMLESMSDSVKIINSATGLTDFSLNISGHLLDINDMNFGKNVHAKGRLNLLSNAILLAGANMPIQNVYGSIDFDDFKYKLNLVSKIATSKILISGDITGGKAALSFNSDKIKISDAIKTFGAQYLSVVPNPYDSSYASFNGSYNGSVTDLDFSKLKLNGQAYFKNLGLIYKKTKMPIKISNGSVLINGGTLNVKALNSTIGTMPATVYGTVNNIFQKPRLNLSIKAQPNQKFVDFVYNKNAIYPIKLKGNISLDGAISGLLNNISLNSNLKISENSSIYYMGSTIGDETLPIVLSTNLIFKPRQINVKSFIYDKVNPTYKKNARIRQLTAGGQLSYRDNDVYFNDFKIKTNVQTDMRIFNIIFKKPLIKKGIFMSDIVANGSAANPYVLGDFDISGMDIPFIDTNVDNLSLKFFEDRILASVRGGILTNKFVLDVNAKNTLKPPFVINSAKLDIGNFDVDYILEELNKIEVNASSRESFVDGKNASMVDLNQIIINNLEVIANSISMRNINASDLIANISMKNGNMKVDKFKFNLAKGTMDGSCGYNLHSKKSEFDLNVADVDADSLLSSILDVKGQLYGDLGGQLSLSCVGSSQLDCLKTLNGHGAFLIKNGRMPKLGSLEYLLKASNLIKSGITGLSVNSIIDFVTPLKTGNFESIKGSIGIHDGVADRIQILSAGKDLNIYVTGNYNFSNYMADMYVFGRLSKKISNVLGPIGNVSLNTLFSAIPGVDLSDPENAPLVSDLNKIPMLELSNKAYRFFAAEISGDINGEDYVKSFKWLE